MIVDSTFYTYVRFPNIDQENLVNEINDFLKIKIEKNEFYISKEKQYRVDFDNKLKEKIQSFLPFKSTDMGIYQNPPGWEYPSHRDRIRSFVLNMLLVDQIPEFDAGFKLNKGDSLSAPIPYIRNQFVLLNAQKIHYVKNKSTNVTRYIVNIGFNVPGGFFKDLVDREKNSEYFRVKDFFEKNGNIGLYEYK